MRSTAPLLAAAVAAVLISMLAGDARAGACRRTGLDAVVLTHPGDEVPAGAGVLVGWTWQDSGSSTADQVPEDEDPAVRPRWRFLVRKSKRKPTLVAIAPGLAVYRPGKVSGKVSLVDGKNKKLIAIKVGKKKRAFAATAPEVSAVRFTQWTMSRDGTHTSVQADLVAAAPPDAVALVVYAVTATTSRAITWANVKGDSGTQVELYDSPGRCRAHPPELAAPSPGQAVRLAWVDQFGRISPMSAEVTVIEVSNTNGASP